MRIPKVKGHAVNDTKSHDRRDRMKILRGQMLKPQFKEAMRSALSPINTDERFGALLARLDEAEKKQR